MSDDLDGVIGHCNWCERDGVELAANPSPFLEGLYATYRPPGDGYEPGHRLQIPDNWLCWDCYESVCNEWERCEDLTKPLSAFGGESSGA